MTLIETGKRAKETAGVLGILDSDKKNEGLRAAAAALLEGEEDILTANQDDVIKATINGMSAGMIDRLEPVSYTHLDVYKRQGKYHLLFNIPVAIANSLASSLIPSLSRAVAGKNRGQIVSKVSMVIRFSMVIAIPATVGLTVLAGPVCNLLFSRYDNTNLIRMMMYGSLAVVFFSLSTVTNAVLQGINHMQTPLKNAVISLVLHIIVLCVMLFGFKMGIYSVVYSNILFALFMCILNGMAISRYLNYRQEMKKTFILPTIASGIMGGAAYGVYQLVHMTLKSNTIGVLLAIAVAVIVYGILLLKLRCVDEVELSGMPGGTKLVRIAQKCHLM